LSRCRASRKISARPRPPRQKTATAWDGRDGAGIHY
jgi:hypothetical protein